MTLACAFCMGATRFTELRAWQLARQLKIEVDHTILANPEARADRKFFEQLSDAVRSGPRNLAEGFGRFGPREFAHFTNIARSSLQEVQNHLLDASDRHFTTEAEHRQLWALSEQALACTTALLTSLNGRKGR
jgi:four helix bundle protein